MYTIDISIKVTSRPCVGIIEPILMWYPDKGMTRKISRDVIPNAFAVMSISPFSSTSKLITFRNISSCFYLQSLSYPNKQHITYDLFFHRGDANINAYFSQEHNKASLPGNVTLEFTQNFGRPHLKRVINYGTIKIFDLKRLKIMQFTGESYNYLSFRVSITPVLPRKCADNIIRGTVHGLPIIDGHVYTTTHKSCFLNMAISNVTYVFVLTSKLSNWYQVKPIWYIHFQKIKCEEVSTGWDTITTLLTFTRNRKTSHTVDFTKDEVFLQSYDPSLSFIYRRSQQCDIVVLSYRDVGTNLLASYIPMNNQNSLNRARIRVSIKSFLAVKYFDSSLAYYNYRVYLYN